MYLRMVQLSHRDELEMPMAAGHARGHRMPPETIHSSSWP